MEQQGAATREIARATAAAAVGTEQVAGRIGGVSAVGRDADKVVEAVQDQLKIKAGETTADNKVSLLTARCIGACGIAPAVVYDGTVTPRQTPESTLEKINQWVKS